MSKIKNEMSKKLNNSSIDQALSRAETHSKQGEFLEAEALYATVIMSFPNNGRAKQGLESLKGVSTQYDPSRPPRATINILMSLINQKMLEPVVKQAENLLNHYPNAIMLWNILGIASAQLSHFDQAIRAFEKIISLTPKEASAHYNLGNVYKDNGLIQQAIEAYTRALELQPNYEHAFNNLTVLLSSQKQVAKKRQLDVLDSYKKLRIVSIDNSQRDFRAGVLLHKEGKLVDAINAYRKAIKQWSNNADAHYNMAHALHDQGKLEEAIKGFKEALKIKPDHADAYYNMGIALQDQGKLDKAIEAYNKAIAIKPDYDNARHIVSALTGKTTTSAPRKYVEELFDGYSKKFEQSLVGSLEYKIPKLLTDMIVKNNSGGPLGAILDLGCGTGLTGLEIKSFCSNLEGIDLSKNMLELANAKNVYDKLVHTDILDYLANMDLCFDYVIATDVFVYLGDLTEVFRLIKSRNKVNGKLAFSIEKNETDGYRLETSGRYSHSKNYIEGLCNEFDYSILSYSEVDLRKENGAFLTGGLYLLSF